MFSHVHVVATEKHRRLLVLILFSFFAALHFLLTKTYRVALAQRIKYLSLSSLNSLVSACVTEDVLVAGYTLRGSPSQEAF